MFCIGGNNSDLKSDLTSCEKYDVYNQKWYGMPSMNHSRSNPGLFISHDKRYMFVFSGFKKYHYNDEAADCPIENTIEKLDLQDR